EVFPRNALAVGDAEMTVPDAIGINDEHRAVAALVEAAGLVDANGDGRARDRLHRLVQLHRRTVNRAIRPRDADKRMASELSRHSNASGSWRRNACTIQKTARSSTTPRLAHGFQNAS